MNVELFISAIEQAGQSPCDKFKCEKRDQCSSELLACTSFRNFLETGNAVTPYMFFPIKVSKNLFPKKLSRIKPTKEIYLSLNDINSTSEDEREKAANAVVSGAIAGRSHLETCWL